MDDHTIHAIELLARTRQRGVKLKRLRTRQTADELDEAAEVQADFAILKTSISYTDLLRAYSALIETLVSWKPTHYWLRLWGGGLAYDC